MSNQEGVTILEDGFEDLLGTGAVAVKTIRQAPQGAPTPEFGQEVHVRYNGMLLPSGTSFAAGEEKRFRVGTGDVIAAMELVVRMMKVGEVVEFNSDSRFAFGENGHPKAKIPPNSAVKYTLELVHLGEEGKLPVEMSLTECIRVAKDKKSVGNEWFERKDFPRAIAHYKSGLDLVKDWQEDQGEDGKSATMDDDLIQKHRERRQIAVDLSNNLSACYLSLEKYKEARDASIVSLQIDSNNVKALLRAAKASRLMDEFEEAKAAIQKIKEVTKGGAESAEVAAEESRLNERMRAIAQKEKNMWKNVLGKKKEEDPSLRQRKKGKEGEGKKQEAAEEEEEEEEKDSKKKKKKKSNKKKKRRASEEQITDEADEEEEEDKVAKSLRQQSEKIRKQAEEESKHRVEKSQFWWIVATVLVILLAQGLALWYLYQLPDEQFAEKDTKNFFDERKRLQREKLAQQQ